MSIKQEVVLKAYIHFIEDLLAINMCKVYFTNNTNGNYETYCIPNKREIYIKLDNNYSLIEYLNAITHELRHQYQYDCIYDKETSGFESDEIVKEWKHNLEHNITLGNEGYNEQPLEVDAHAFSYYMMKVLFSVEMNYEKQHMDIYGKRYVDIANDFLIDEIRECLNENDFVDYYNYVIDDIRSRQSIN